MGFLMFVIFLAACGVAGSTGALFPPGDWYRNLEKPGWTPPNWMFPVMWTSLYVLMAWAATRVALVESSGMALALWALQIALNTLWTPVFFGLHRIRAGLLIIGLLWLSIAATIAAFAAIDWIAALMMIPYLGWVSVAAALNRAILQLNPDKAAT